MSQLLGRTVFLRLLLAGVAGLALARDVRALDPETPLTRYGRRVWDTTNGLPQGTVLDLAQTSEGYVWIATQQGLVRFDGTEFMLYDSVNTPEMRHSYVTTLHADSNGTLWAGTPEGLLIYSGGRFRRMGIEDGLPGNSVTAAAEANDGSIWIGTEGQGVVRIVGANVDPSTRALPTSKITSIVSHPDGGVWAGTTDAGAFRIQRGRTPEPIGGLPSVRVRSFTLDRKQGLWIGTEEGVAYLARGASSAVRDQRPDLSHANTWSILEDSAGTLWLATLNAGLIRVVGNTVTRLGKEALRDTWALSLLEDAQHNLWVGTSFGGLVQLRDTPFMTLDKSDGLPSNVVITTLEADGMMWVGTYDGFASIVGGRTTRYTAGPAIPTAVWAMAKRRRGGIWVGSFGGDLSYVQDGRVHRVLGAKDLPSPLIYGLAEDHDGALWIGTFNGLLRYQSGQLRQMTAADGITDRIIRGLTVTRDGALWIATRTKGLIRLKNGKATTYDTGSGLSHNLVMGLIEDRDGTLWVTTWNGISRIRNGKVVSFNTKDGLHVQNPHSVVDDERGNLWFTSNVGIFSVRKKELEDVAAGRIPRFVSSVYETDDGMLNKECNGGAPGSWRSADGRLWFPTVAGVAVSNPGAPRRDEGRNVIIEKATFDGVPFVNQAAISASKKRLEVRFTAPEFRWPSRVVYRYKLEGFDEDWSEVSSRKRASYTNLPPGDYRFWFRPESATPAPGDRWRHNRSV